MKTTTPSETREEFRTRLLERDSCCVWTGMGAEYGNGLHIIPFKRGSEVCVVRLSESTLG